MPGCYGHLKPLGLKTVRTGLWTRRGNLEDPPAGVRKGMLRHTPKKSLDSIVFGLKTRLEVPENDREDHIFKSLRRRSSLMSKKRVENVGNRGAAGKENESRVIIINKKEESDLIRGSEVLSLPEGQSPLSVSAKRSTLTMTTESFIIDASPEIHAELDHCYAKKSSSTRVIETHSMNGEVALNDKDPTQKRKRRDSLRKKMQPMIPVVARVPYVSDMSKGKWLESAGRRQTARKSTSGQSERETGSSSSADDSDPKRQKVVENDDADAGSHMSAFEESEDTLKGSMKRQDHEVAASGNLKKKKKKKDFSAPKKTLSRNVIIIDSSSESDCKSSNSEDEKESSEDSDEALKEVDVLLREAKAIRKGKESLEIPARTRSKTSKILGHNHVALEVPEAELLQSSKSKPYGAKGLLARLKASRNRSREEESDLSLKVLKLLGSVKSSSSESASSSSSSSSSSEEESDESSDANVVEIPAGKEGDKRKLPGGLESSSESTDVEEEAGDEGKAEKKKKRKKKTRKARMITSSSSEDEEDDDDDDDDDKDAGEEDSPNKRGRRNIRKVWSDKKLRMETKQAQKEEEERLERLRKLDEARAHWKETSSQDKQRRVVLETDAKDPSKVILEISDYMVKVMKPHQIEGIRFVWNCVLESVKAVQSGPGSGCILAHCMGLGKTVQVMAVLDLLWRNRDVLQLPRLMVIAPVNAINVWIDEYTHWVPEEHIPDKFIMHWVKGNHQKRLSCLEGWHRMGGLLVIGYEMYRSLCEGTHIRDKASRDRFIHFLRDPGPDVVVCDEGHVLRNHSSRLSMTINQIRTKRRIVLTGTPLQNNLNEYYTMVNFVKPNLLGSNSEFQNRFANPIGNGQHRDSTPYDVRLMKERSHVLHKLLSSCIQRKDYSVLLKYLPPLHEYAVFVRMTPLQIQLYERYLRTAVGHGDSAGMTTHVATMGIFRCYHELMRIWSHPWLVKLREEQEEERKANLMEDFLASGSDDSSSSKDNHSDDEVQLIEKPEEKESASVWYEDLISEGNEMQVELSSKLVVLMEILQGAEAMNDKVLVFSQSLLLLDLLEAFLQDGPNLCKGLDYYRIDGSTDAETRRMWANNFNKKKNKRLRLLLVSTKAGSLGMNLAAANRVVLFDVSWNPSHDAQSLFRAYRFGQDKEVSVYRLVAMGTMEEKVYDRQITKTSLSHRVIDERQIDRHFTMADLTELFHFDAEEVKNAKADADQQPPDDPLLAFILEKFQPEHVVRYHDHNSLLVDREEEHLTEEEKKQAWEGYEREKLMRETQRETQLASLRQLQLANDAAQRANAEIQRQTKSAVAAATTSSAAPIVMTSANIINHLEFLRMTNSAKFLDTLNAMAHNNATAYHWVVSQRPGWFKNVPANLQHQHQQ